MEKKLKAIVIVIAIFLFSQTLTAADTCETFDLGASDLEFYLGYDGIGLEKNQGVISAEVVAGFGITERFSALISLSGESNEYFSNGTGGAGFGIFGTIVDTDHFDVDLFLNAGIGPDSFSISPSIEINIDLKPDLELAGIYFRVEEMLAGRDESTDNNEKHAFAGELGITSGIYYSIHSGHQLLLEYDMTVLNNPDKGEERLNIGGIALGYNVVVHKKIELISQFFYDVPQNDERHAFGLSLGAVVTM